RPPSPRRAPEHLPARRRRCQRRCARRGMVPATSRTLRRPLPDEARSDLSEATAYSPFSTDVMVDPYPHYDWLRREQPVAWVEEFVAVRRYRDVETVLRDPGTFSSRLGNTREVMPTVANTTMITSDPPEHTALRGLVNRAFTPRLVAAMEEHIR